MQCHHVYIAEDTPGPSKFLRNQCSLGVIYRLELDSLMLHSAYTASTPKPSYLTATPQMRSGHLDDQLALYKLSGYAFKRRLSGTPTRYLSSTPYEGFIPSFLGHLPPSHDTKMLVWDAGFQEFRRETPPMSAFPMPSDELTLTTRERQSAANVASADAIYQSVVRN